ncbi:MAG: PaaI family thioesterase [Veillonella sp.]|uniref:PaaI family thioesterase n=1 Tax=Veillonella sp. TaxID=1926307 RepID=UPI0025D14CA8|nr:PaaI family thioesterase [Veillonella sp.]MBE6079486.1 PaaI family thioesterase [Veillonella sp.]
MSKKQGMRTLVDFFDKMCHEHTFAWSKYTRVTGGDPGHLEILFDTDAVRHGNFIGNVHGGVYMSLADTVMGVSCFTLGKRVVTLEMKGNFIKAVKAGEKLRAVGNVEHNGNRTMVTTGRLYNTVGDLVYMSTGTFYVIDKFEMPDLPWRV